MPLRLILDTNIFSRDRARRTQEFRTLYRLCTRGQVALIVPYIVKREFETQLDAFAAEVVKQFESSSKKIHGGPIPGDIRDSLGALLALLDGRRGEILGSYTASFNSWLLECQATVLQMDAAQAQATMEGYFAGTKPFKAIKSREDIPDGLIYQAVVEAARADPIVFVSSDKAISEAAADLDRVTHYRDLGGFIASEGVQSLIAEMDESQSEAIIEQIRLLPSDESNPLVDFIMSRGGEGLVGTYFHSPSIPGDDKEAYVDMFGDLSNVELEWDEAAYHGDSVYTLPFSATGFFYISYYVPKWDVIEIEKRGGHYTEHNDYVVEAQEDAELYVSGTLRFKISQDVDPDESISDAIEAVTVDSLDDPRLLEDME